MTNDDLLNLILGNNANGPSAAQFANGTFSSPFTSQPPAQSFTGTPAGSYNSQPASNGVNLGNAPLSSLFETGLGGDVIASMLPQLGDTSAPSAFLSPSSLQPPSALYDPNPPAPTVDQLALMLGMSPQGVASIRDQAENQVRMRDTAGDLAQPYSSPNIPPASRAFPW